VSSTVPSGTWTRSGRLVFLSLPGRPVPNAGEPKGYGEINAEITCCGQTVRPGDWIAGDENGVVVIPRERAYEVARRAREVQKTGGEDAGGDPPGRNPLPHHELEKWEKAVRMIPHRALTDEAVRVIPHRALTG